MREDEIARDLVARGVARDASVGWAIRTRRGWVRGAGWASQAGSSASEPIFDLASVTKPLTAFAVARGPFPRDARLLDVLPEVRGTASEGATIEALLSHRAGLDAHVALYEAADFDPSVALRVAAGSMRASGASPAALYSDLGYILAGAALARTCGASDAGEVIERLVVHPLGCEDEIGTARTLRERVAFADRVRPTEILERRGGEVRGLVHDDNAFALTAEGGSGHAGMFGTANGLLTFGCAAHDAIVDGTGPLAAGDLTWLVEPRPGGSLRAGFDGKSGEGSSVGTVAGPRTFGHLGFTGTSLWIDPDVGAVVVLLTNRVHPTRENVAIREARPEFHDALFTLARTHASL